MTGHRNVDEVLIGRRAGAQVRDQCFAATPCLEERVVVICRDRRTARDPQVQHARAIDADQIDVGPAAVQRLCRFGLAAERVEVAFVQGRAHRQDLQPEHRAADLGIDGGRQRARDVDHRRLHSLALVRCAFVDQDRRQHHQRCDGADEERGEVASQLPRPAHRARPQGDVDRRRAIPVAGALGAAAIGGEGSLGRGGFAGGHRARTMNGTPARLRSAALAIGSSVNAPFERAVPVASVRSLA